MLILGVNADQADVSAALLNDGRLVAAVEEERLTRVKHCTGFPTEAIRSCLAIAGVGGGEIDHVACCGDPRAHALRRVLLTLRHRPSPGELRRRAEHWAGPGSLRQGLAEALDLPADGLPPIHRVEHHVAHLASAYYASPFEGAAVCSADGVGDLVTTAIGQGQDSDLRVLGRLFFPDSIGTLFTAVTQHLGFPAHGDEYKVMGLAAFGQPAYAERLWELVRLCADGSYQLNHDYFADRHDRLLVASRGGRAPRPRRLYGPKFEELLGPARGEGEPLTSRQEDIAASLQEVFEETAIHVLCGLAARTGERRLCVAGGCFMNSVLSGKIRSRTPFEEVFIQPAAGDNGTSMGAALWVWCRKIGGSRSFTMKHAYWGTAYSANAIAATLQARARDLSGYSIVRYPDEGELCGLIAALIADGNLVGWFQGAMEFGARALGNRSLLADPRRSTVKDRLNMRVKRRESFRPFAPSLAEDALDRYFADATPDPFMVTVHQVRDERRAEIPATVHVDGTARPHTVNEVTNSRYLRLIRQFDQITGVPVLLNTSLNENEPIVESPDQAIACLLRTGMDALVLGETVIQCP